MQVLETTHAAVRTPAKQKAIVDQVKPAWKEIILSPSLHNL